jgi:hypothetical protein
LRPPITPTLLQQGNKRLIQRPHAGSGLPSGKGTPQVWRAQGLWRPNLDSLASVFPRFSGALGGYARIERYHRVIRTYLP